MNTTRRRSPRLTPNNADPSEGPGGEKGLGTEEGVAGGPGPSDQDVTAKMPDARGEVRYPPGEEPDEMRPRAVPQEGHVEEDADTAGDGAPNAKD